MDVVVILDDWANEKDFDYVSDSAWEAGFEHGIVIVPVVFTRSEWENSPERYSLLVQAVDAEGSIFMKEQEIVSLIRHRLEQAQTALDDARFLLKGTVVRRV